MDNRLLYLDPVGPPEPEGPVKTEELVCGRWTPTEVRQAAQRFGRDWRAMLIEFDKMADDGPYGRIS